MADNKKWPIANRPANMGGPGSASYERKYGGGGGGGGRQASLTKDGNKLVHPAGHYIQTIPSKRAGGSPVREVWEYTGVTHKRRATFGYSGERGNQMAIKRLHEVAEKSTIQNW